MQPDIDDPHEVLGLAPGASRAQAKAAWRRLASQWHPDRNRGAEAARQMQRVNAAWARLCALDAEPADDPPDPGDEAPAAGAILQRRVRLSLEEAARGSVRWLRGRQVLACSTCAGSGQARSELDCEPCAGSGRVRTGWWFGWPATPTACGACDGRGRLRPACPECDGEGERRLRWRRRVRFPAGLRAGDVVIAPPGALPDGCDATLELQVELRPHPFWRLADDGTLHATRPVDTLAWLAEAWIEVPTPHGLQQMRLRRGRSVYRLRGQGWPLRTGDGACGDLVVTLQPLEPAALSAAQQRRLAKLAAEIAADPAAQAPALREWQARLDRWAGRGG